MDIESLIANLGTNWKDVLLSICPKYKDVINKSLTDDMEKFEDVLSIVPPRDLIFAAFNRFDTDKLRVCIISQDPYINVGEAMGLCFSVPHGVKCPPSLRNIFKELEDEYGQKRTNTDLIDWSDQGVLLLNTALTTLEGKSGHHLKVWKDFTNDVVKHLGQQHENIVYMLWGAHAQSYESLINPEKNLILKHSHPSPLSRKSFVGNNHFRLCNTYLNTKGFKEINWI
jgi:uracil-DNA glycosylase